MIGKNCCPTAKPPSATKRTAMSKQTPKALKKALAIIYNGAEFREEEKIWEYALAKHGKFCDKLRTLGKDQIPGDVVETVRKIIKDFAKRKSAARAKSAPPPKPSNGKSGNSHSTRRAQANLWDMDPAELTGSLFPALAEGMDVDEEREPCQLLDFAGFDITSTGVLITSCRKVVGILEGQIDNELTEQPLAVCCIRAQYDDLVDDKMRVTTSRNKPMFLDNVHFADKNRALLKYDLVMFQLGEHPVEYVDKNAIVTEIKGKVTEFVTLSVQIPNL